MDARRSQVRLAGEQIPDHDFVLRLPAAGDLPGAAAWASPAAEGAYFMAAILPPRANSEPLQVPREFIFVLDRSGSMSGGPILQARNALRACLRALNPDDTFRVLLFDDQLEWYQPEPSAVTQAAVDCADAFLSQVDARGGTEIIGALEAALSLPSDPRRTRLVVFLTDGAVSAEAAALEALGRRLGAARVFTFGIGPSVNRALLARMARLGKGASEFLQADEDIEGAVIRFQDRVSFPVLTDLTLRWESGNAWDIYPARLPDLYMGQALELCGRVRPANGPARLVVSGKRGEERFEQLLELAVPAQPDEALGRVWARARVDDLLEEAALDPRRSDALRAAVIGLALEHHLVTPFTAFAALDETAVAAGGKPMLIKVSQPLPQGLDFGVDMPQSFASAAMMPPSVAPAPMRSAKMGPARRAKTVWMAALPQDDAVPDVEAMDGAMPLAETTPPYTSARGREETLRELARTQRLDGSWGGEVELTAAALLAFVRAGHTATAGSFRQAVRRAANWLAAQPASGFPAQARARALRELAERGGDAKMRAAADAAEQGLPALAPFPAGVTRAADLETLRLASLLRIQVQIDPGLESSSAGQAWVAALM
jgi:Ca-activated chloride channel family protein